MLPRCLPQNVGSIQHMVLVDLFEKFQDDCHNAISYMGMILAMLNLHVALMPPVIEVSVKLDVWFWRCRLTNFKMGVTSAVRAISDIRREQLEQISM